LFGGRFGSVAVIEYIPKAAVRTAGMGGIADLAIHQKQPLVSGKLRIYVLKLRADVCLNDYSTVTLFARFLG